LKPQEFNKLSFDDRRKLFVEARNDLGISQSELGKKLKPYGYSGGRATVQSWELGKVPVPFLVYILISNWVSEVKK
jgi:hypothetical protein